MKKARRFTGYHATAIIASFFAVVIAVNFTMASFAVSTFGGTVVDNSYVASQKFNGWLAEARQEEKLGWTMSDAVRQDDRLLVTIAEAEDVPLTGADVTIRLEHPLGRTPSRNLHFTEIRPGTFLSRERVPAGRWKLRAHIRRDGRERNLAFEMQ